jgi:hypothetical protein
LATPYLSISRCRIQRYTGPVMQTRADDLGKLTVLDERGNTVSVASLWQTKTAVLVFTRHFG